MTALSFFNPTEKRFMDHVVQQKYGNLQVNSLLEANALFNAIQRSFDGSNYGDFVSTDPYLVHNLAACTSIVMEYDAGEEIPWDLHDDILGRTLRGFMWTLARLIKNGEIRQNKHEEWLINAFTIPDWFAKFALSNQI